jgi:hypothetical protein
MGIAKRYIKKIHNETTFYATWTPSQVLALGDYGALDKEGVFVRKGNLADLGFGAVQKLSEPRPDDFLSIATESGTSVTVKAAGDALAASKLPDAKAGVTFGFTKADSLVCKLKGPKQEAIGNIKAVQDFVIAQYKGGMWTKDWRIVNQRVIADGTTIVYADTEGVDVEATAEAPIQDIADASLKFSVVYKTGGSVNVIGASNLSPFVSLVRLYTSIFHGPRVESFTPDMVAKGEVTPTLVAEVPE